MITNQSKESLDYIRSLTGIKLTLGEMLRSIRQGEETTQVDFSKKLNISRQNLCDIEHGRRFISPKVAAEYADKLGLLDRDGINLEVEIKKAA